jgi:L-ribulose-5-phosphate 3-epimerase
MKKAIMNGCFPSSMSLPERFELAAEAGFQGIEIGLAQQGFFSFEGPAGDVQEVAALARKTGVAISGMLAGPMWQFPPTANDAAVREQAKRMVRRSIEVAADLGVDTLLLVPGKVEADVPYGVAWERAQQFIRDLLPDCERHRVTLAVENVWNKMLYTPMEMKLFIDQIGHPLVGAYFDAGNHVPFTWPEHWPPVLGERIKRVHVKGFNSKAGYSFTGFVRLLDGDIDWKQVMDALRGIGYDGWVTIEIGASRGDPRRSIHEYSADMDRLLAL